ncbi:MAG: S9 family peptidase [Saprospiraceae bacterium]
MLIDKAKTLEAPKAEIIPYSHNFHGDIRIDNYNWMRLSDEQKNSSQQDSHTQKVIEYLQAENSYREKLTAHMMPLENKIFEEIKSRIKQTDMSVPYKENGYYYITKYEESKEYPIYTRRKNSLDSIEEIMLNVNELASDHQYYSIGRIDVSEDNSLIAYPVDTVSRRQYTIHFKNLETGVVYPDTIPNTSGNVIWANDNKNLFYSVKNEALRDYKILRHKLGTPVEEDVLIYHETNESYNTFIYKTKSKKFLVIGSSSIHSDEYQILDADKPEQDFVLFQKRINNLEYSIDHFDDGWYILTNKDDAFNFKVMRTSLDQTAIENWKEFIAHDESIFIEKIKMFKNFMVMAIRKGGITQLEIRPWKAESYYVPFEEESYFVGISKNPEFDTDLLRLTYTSLTTPNSTYDFNVNTKHFTLLKQQEVIGNFNKEDYATERKLVKVADGSLVPLSIVYKKGMVRNASHPLLLYGYGSYGLSMDPMFSSSRLSLIDRGFVYAIAHIRGGQEMGRKWYEKGKLLDKKNSFTDFIECASYLLENKYCDPNKLYAMGGSAGGLLMGTVLNMAPKLWSGIIAAVPFVDVVTTMLDESIPLTVGEFDEWGNPKIKEYYNYIKSYSPIDNIAETEFPPILVTTGFHDSQVQYWEPAKWVALLRHKQRNQSPILLYCNMETGHGGASGRFKILHEIAMEYTFLLELAGITN